MELWFLNPISFYMFYFWLYLQNHARPHNYQFKIFHQSKNGNYFAQTLPRRMESKRSPSPQKIAFKDKTNAAVASGFNSLKRMTRTSASERPTKEERPNRMVKSSTYGGQCLTYLLPPHPHYCTLILLCTSLYCVPDTLYPWLYSSKFFSVQIFWGLYHS